jgi:LPS-assembly protein
MRCRLAPLTIAVLYALIPAAYGEDEPLKLKLDRTLNPMSQASDMTPAFITADHMEGKKENRIEAVGNAELRKGGRAFFADRLLYQQDSKMVYADGSVRIEQDGSTIFGPHLEFNLNTDVGEMTQPSFLLSENDSRGNAESLHIEGKHNFALYNTTYTTCPAGDDDWLLKISELDIDRSTQIGVAHNARVDFMGVPILYTPWMDFALNNGRKTGFLGPETGGTTTGGSEITLPFYWNIAPNYDATFAPRFMAKRGTLYDNEFRYLGSSSYDELHLDVLPQDRIAQQSRIHESLVESRSWGGGFSSTLNLNRVSDDAYFRDLSTSVTNTSQVNLLREGALNYRGGWWNATTRIQNYQTLQDPAAPVPVPYHLTPQFVVNAQRPLDNTASVAFAGEYVDFTHPTLINAQRIVLNPSVSLPLLSDPAYYVTPKIGYHYTDYIFGQNNSSGLANMSRSLPIFSVDSGMVFERGLSIGGTDYVHTLEPRAYYVYIPYRNQDAIPVFDTVQSDFNFTQMFTENRFIGSDRIGDANQLTLAATSRFFNVESGLEQFRVTLGERFSFAAPRVNLVAPTDTTNKSDILMNISGRISRVLSLDGMWQYNPSQTHTEMYGTSLHYQPEAGKVINMGYLFTRNTLRQIDLSEQLPLAGRWHTVARWNYSLQDKRLVEALAGVEYNQICWGVQIVAQRFTTATQQVSTGFFIQLNLNGLAGVGSDPLDTLRHSIPGYTSLNQNISSDTLQGLQ